MLWHRSILNKLARVFSTLFLLKFLLMEIACSVQSRLLCQIPIYLLLNYEVRYIRCIYIYKKCVYDKFRFLVLARTIIELVKNKTHYINQCSKHVGLFNEALRRTCSNSRSSELYELVALASVLQCEVQSVYPYIDYRAEMKIMNAVYKPAEISVSSNGRVIIFWSSTEDEVSTRARPGNNGIWNPNHCVPLLQQHRNSQTATKMRASTIRDVKHERV